MFVISTNFEGEKRTVDLHQVRIPGGVLAKDLPGHELYREMARIGVPNIKTSDGWQTLAFALGVFNQRRAEKLA